MKIYYFGTLIEENGRKVADKINSIQAQLTLNFSEESPKVQPKKTGMDSIGDILKDIDLSLDVYRPFQKVLQ